MLLIGLAVGVDYSMFYLKREREERAAGRSQQAALEAAAATSGRSVLISGLTVMVAMAGLFLTGDATFASFGVRDDHRRRGRDARLADRAPGAALEARRPGRPAARAARRPAPPRRRRRAHLGRDRRPRPAPAALSAVLAGGLLLALAAPALQLRIATPGPEARSRSRSTSSRRTTGCSRRSRARALPGERRRQGAERERARGPGGDRQLEQRALASGQMGEPITVDVNEDGTVANITVPIAGTGTDPASNTALTELRDEIVPTTVGALPDAEAGVTGQTARWKDRATR